MFRVPAKLLPVALVVFLWQFQLFSTFEHHHNPLLWLPIDKFASTDQELVQATFNIISPCEMLDRLKPTIPKETFDQFRIFCDRKAERSMLRKISTTCRLSSKLHEPFVPAKSERTLNGTTVLGFLNSMLRVASLSTDSLVTAFNSSLPLDPTEVQNTVSELKKLRDAQLYDSRIFNSEKVQAMFTLFRSAYEQNPFSTIPAGFFELFNSSNQPDNLADLKLHRCELELRPGVKTLKMTLKVSRPLMLLEAREFPQLIKGSGSCLIRYVGPKRIVLNSADRTYCPDPSSSRWVLKLDRLTCRYPQPISSLYSQFEIQPYCHRSAAIDPALLIKIQRMGELTYVQCAGFQYLLANQEFNCPDQVFAVPSDLQVFVKANNRLIGFNASANQFPGEELLNLDNNTYSKTLSALEHQQRTHENPGLFGLGKRQTDALALVVACIFCIVIFILVICFACYRPKPRAIKPFY